MLKPSALRALQNLLRNRRIQLPRCIMLQGLEKHGVGRWREIGEEFLPKWDDQALRVKTTRLLGSQSLARYIGWQGNRCRPLQCVCTRLGQCVST